MGQAYFYHLTQAPLEVTLRSLLEKSLQAGWRVAVRGQSAALIERLDAALWQGPAEGFLPHGRACGRHDARQPVLLTTAVSAPANDPQCLISVEGAAIQPAEAAAMARVMVLFDGRDEAAVEVARGQWRALVAAGIGAVYWSEAGGRWEKKADSGGAA